MWIRRRRVRIEVEQVSLRVEGHQPATGARAGTEPAPQAYSPRDVLDGLLSLPRNRDLLNAHSTSLQDETK